MAKKLEKNYSNQLHANNVDLTETDTLLNEKEQSLKKKIFDLAKMESLVHNDEKLSGIYNHMSEDGEEKYGYHHNETIMNIIFNEYVLNDANYLQKYKNAIPARKKRRDKSGIIQLQKKAGQDVKSENYNHNNSLPGVMEDEEGYMGDEPQHVAKNYYTFDPEHAIRRTKKFYDTMKEPIEKRKHKNIMTGEELIEYAQKELGEYFNEAVNALNKAYDSNEANNIMDHYLKLAKGDNNDIDETTTAASSGAFAPPLGFKTDKKMHESHDHKEKEKDEEEELDETTTSTSSGQYSGPFGKKRDKKLDQPAWKGGEIIGENENYLINPKAFKKYYQKLNEAQLNKPELNIPDLNEVILDRLDLSKIDTEFLQKILNDLLNAKVQSDTLTAIQQELKNRGILNEDEDPCWDGYVQYGTKEKDGKEIPNCIPEGMTSPNDDSLVPLAEHHFDTREDKIDFIKDNYNEYYDKDLPNLEKFTDEEVDDLYDNLERKMGLIESNINENQLNTKEEKVAYIIEKGQGKFGDLETLDRMSDQDIDRILQQVKGSEKTLDPAANKFMEEEKVYEKAESQAQQKFMGMVRATQKGDMKNPSPEVAKAAKEMKPSDVKDFASTKHKGLPEKVDEYGIDENPLLGVAARTAIGSKVANKVMGEDMQSMIQPKSQTMATSGNSPDTIIQTMKEIYEDLGDYLNDIDVENDIKQIDEKQVEVKVTNDNKLDNFGKSKSGIGGQSGSDFAYSGEPVKPKKMEDLVNEENEVNEDGHCRKDEVPVAGKTPGTKGSCRKKTTPVDSEERKKNKHNVEVRLKRERKKSTELEKEKERYMKDLEKNRKQMKKLKEGLFEDKRPSALVQMDRLHKDNEKNFDADFKDSNTEDLKIKPDELTFNDQITIVGDNPYELGEKIEKEKLDQNKGVAFKNVGNSTNDDNDEIIKKNLTSEEEDQLVKDRGLGMQDIVYDLKPSDRFEDRMKNDMGEEHYNIRQEKMKYRSEAPMYNKDTEPVGNGKKTTQFDKNKKKYNNYDGYTTNESMITGKYKNDINKTCFVNFKLNETKEVNNVDNYIELNLEGLGNVYTQQVNENVEMRNIMDNFKFYYNGENVVKLKFEKMKLNESETKEKIVNKQYEKMKKLMGYNPSKHINTSNVKKKRGF